MSHKVNSGKKKVFRGREVLAAVGRGRAESVVERFFKYNIIGTLLLLYINVINNKYYLRQIQDTSQLVRILIDDR
jgi:hypothetical protein